MSRIQPKPKILRASPSVTDAQLAHESSVQLHRIVKSASSLRLTVIDVRDGELELPTPAVELLIHLLSQLAEGRSVTLIPAQAELTTQQVADALGVSRPFVVKEIEERRLPARRVGRHRRVLLEDLLEYKRRSDASRQQALDTIAALDEELGLT